MKSLQKEQNSTNLLLWPPIHPGINLQSPQSDSTLWTLTLGRELIIRLARHLAKGYKGLDQEIVSLFSAANIYLFPMVDYEYFDTSNEGNCSSFLSKYSNLCIFSSLVRSVFHFLSKLEIYIQSAPNNSNETYTFMCLGRAGCFGQC